MWFLFSKVELPAKSQSLPVSHPKCCNSSQTWRNQGVCDNTVYITRRKRIWWRHKVGWAMARRPNANLQPFPVPKKHTRFLGLCSRKSKRNPIYQSLAARLPMEARRNPASMSSWHNQQPFNSQPSGTGASRTSKPLSGWLSIAWLVTYRPMWKLTHSVTQQLMVVSKNKFKIYCKTKKKLLYELRWVLKNSHSREWLPIEKVGRRTI